MEHFSMSYHEFTSKKVVFKFPYRNKSCFTFFRAFELIEMLRLATQEEIERGERIDDDICREGKLVVDEKIKVLVNEDINFKKEVEDILFLIKKQEEDLKVIRDKLIEMIIDFVELKSYN